MMLHRCLRQLAGVALAVLAVAATSPAGAQNYDGAGLVRFGLFGQGTWVAASAVETNDVAPIVVVGRGSADISGLGVGVSIGYDHRIHGHMIIGIEADWVYVGSEDRWNLITVTADYTASVRARLGVYVHPHMLLYVTGGVAMLGLEAEHPLTTRDTSTTVFGWTIGAGTEINWHHVILFGEYLYADYERWNFAVPGSQFSVDSDSHVFRLGIKFKVGHDHYHDDVRYGRPMK